MSKNKNFQGIIPPMLTSFTKDGDLYEEGIRNCVDFLIEHGVHGFWDLVALVWDHTCELKKEKGR